MYVLSSQRRLRIRSNTISQQREALELHKLLRENSNVCRGGAKRNITLLIRSLVWNLRLDERYLNSRV